MDVFVAGASMVKVERHYDKGAMELADEAVKRLTMDLKDEVRPDALIVANTYGELTGQRLMIGSRIANSLGLNSPFTVRVEEGDAGGGAAVSLGYSMVKSGIARKVLVLGVEKLTDYSSKYMNEVYSQTVVDEYQYFAGVSNSSIAAILMRQYLRKYKVDYSYFSTWPILMHSNAVENPYAYLKFKVDQKTIVESQVISDPLRLFDVGARADGASCILMTSNEVARKFTDAPVKLTGLGYASSPYDYTPSLPSLKLALRRMLQGTGLRLREVDVVEIHDSYSIIAALILEEAGLAESGKAFDRLAGVNPSGGLKARGYPGGSTGVYQVAEVFMQLAGQYPGKRVKGARSGLVISTDDLATSSYVISLEV